MTTLWRTATILRIPYLNWPVGSRKLTTANYLGGLRYGASSMASYPDYNGYSCPLTQVQAMERLCSRFVRRWLGVPPSISSVNLYSKTSKLCLPVSLVEGEFKATKARAVSTLLLSKDEKVRHANKTEMEAAGGSEQSGILLETSGNHWHGLPRTTGKLESQELV